MKHHNQQPGLTPTKVSAFRLAATLIGVLAVAACASTPLPPTAALQAAELSITKAEEARIADYSSPELALAREKLTAARAAVSQEQMTLALHLAEQSRAEADLAAAKAEVSKAKAVNDEMRKSTDIVKQEMQRNPGVQP